MIYEKLKDIEQRLESIEDKLEAGYSEPEEEPAAEYVPDPEQTEAVEEEAPSAEVDGKKFDDKYAVSPPPEKKKFVPKEDKLDMPEQKEDFSDW